MQEVFLQSGARVELDAGAGGPHLLVRCRAPAIDRLRSGLARAAALASTAEMPEPWPSLRRRRRLRQGEAVRGALALPPRSSARALLAYFEGLADRDRARLDQPLGTVKTRMRSGMLRCAVLRGSGAGAACETGAKAARGPHTRPRFFERERKTFDGNDSTTRGTRPRRARRARREELRGFRRTSRPARVQARARPCATPPRCLLRHAAGRAGRPCAAPA